MSAAFGRRSARTTPLAGLGRSAMGCSPLTPVLPHDIVYGFVRFGATVQFV
jgi:hypothetical protein